MKIAYFTDLLLTSIGGVSNSILNLSSVLEKEKHEVIIFAPDSSKKERRPKNFKQKTVFLSSISSYFNPRLRISSPISTKLGKIVKKFNPDIIHVHTPFLAGGNAILLGKIFQKPIIGTFHTYFMEPEYLKAFGITNPTPVLTNFLWKYASFFYNQCDVVICPSKLVKKDLIKHGAKKPIHVISNVINEDKFKLVNNGTLAELKKKYSLKKNVVMYVGRLSYEKSLDVLIKSFARVVKEIPDVSLLIVGEGQIKKELQILSNNLHIDKNVIFTGSVEQDRLLSCGFFQVADIFATSSTSEVQPVSLIEALYFGLPIVGVAKRGVLDVVDGVGLLSQPGNITQFYKNILKVLKNSSLKEQLRKKARRTFVERYSTKKVVQNYENLYENCNIYR